MLLYLLLGTIRRWRPSGCHGGGWDLDRGRPGAGWSSASGPSTPPATRQPTDKAIAEQALTGPATVIIAGIAEGMKSTWVPMLTTVVAIIGAFGFAGGAETFPHGPVRRRHRRRRHAHHAGHHAGHRRLRPDRRQRRRQRRDDRPGAVVRERTDALDSLGNTTAATGKGFAIGSAALTALALLAAYVQVVQSE